MHKKLSDCSAALNEFYVSEPSMWEVDFTWNGFEWIDCDDTDNSVISFVRKAKDGKNFVIAVCNFTPEVRHGYRIGVPREGIYEEVFNTDETRWGGSGVQNTGRLETEAVPWQWRDNSLVLTLPPLATVYLKFREEKKKPRAKEHVESRRDIK